MVKFSAHAKRCLSFALLLFSSSINAFELTLSAKDGEPLANVFVAIPEGSIEAPAMVPAVMDQVDVSFVPHVLAVDQGQEVVFPNSDSIRHHVYSFSKPKQFEIKLYDGVPLSPVRFEQAGVVVLGCNIHDSMQGYIVVSPWPEYGVTDSHGKISFRTKPEHVAVWHPSMAGQSEPKIVALTAADLEQGVLNLSVARPEHRAVGADERSGFKNPRRAYDD